MSLGPFDPAPVIARIKASVGELRQVRGVSDYAAVTSLLDFTPPEAFVYTAAETGVETKSGMSLPGKQTPIAQQMQVVLGVVVVARNYREQRGDQLRDELLGFVGKVRAPLLGWTPPVNGGRALQLLRGDLADYDKSTALWVDYWTTQHIIKPEITP